MIKKILFSKFSRMIIFLFLLFSFLYLIFDQLIMPAYTRHGQEITVPDLTSTFYEDARDQLKQLDLKLVEESKKFDVNNIFPIGVVMSQTPKPNSKVKNGRRIYVTVSKGEPVLEMPQLIHHSERNAIFMLENKGLELGNIFYEHSDIFHAGVISYQSIPAGTEIKPGTIINITVSHGRLPDRFIVPDLINRSLKDVRKIIFQAGLTLGEISFQTEEDLIPETVINQSLEANLEVTQGDTINLVVSKLPETN